MPAPRLSIRLFLVLCLLMGAIGVPWGWKQYQAYRTAEKEKVEIKNLRKNLAAAYAEQPPKMNGFILRPPPNPPPRDVAYEEWDSRVKEMEDRLEQLTGKRPTRPARPMIDVF